MKIPPRIASCLALAPLPLVRAVTRSVFTRVLDRHPGLFERLDAQARKSFAFVPTDLAFAFIVLPARRTISVQRKRAPIRADATATGPFLILLALLEGRIDGDAMFFSRDLSVSGDMEAMLALRNALDDCSFDLPRDLGASAGPLGPLVRRSAARIRERALGSGGRAWN
jgi:predicted lipid carrier protein YhbT